jgi:hypothetical protein
MVNNSLGYKICLNAIISQCVLYNDDGSCYRCASGNPYDSSSGVATCPSTAVALLPNCQTAIKLSGQNICIACIPNYTLDATKNCIKQILMCSIYQNGQCTRCVTGYYLKNSTCYKQSDQCTYTDSNGICLQCATGFSVQNGICVKNP